MAHHAVHQKKRTGIVARLIYCQTKKLRREPVRLDRFIYLAFFWGVRRGFKREMHPAVEVDQPLPPPLHGSWLEELLYIPLGEKKVKSRKIKVQPDEAIPWPRYFFRTKNGIVPTVLG